MTNTLANVFGRADDFQKLYDKAFKEVEKDTKKMALSADELRAKTTERAVQAVE